MVLLRWLLRLVLLMTLLDWSRHHRLFTLGVDVVLSLLLVLVKFFAGANRSLTTSSDLDGAIAT